MKRQNIWYVSKYAVTPLFGGASRQYFFSKYFCMKGRSVNLVTSRSASLKSFPNLGWHNHVQYNIDGVKSILLNGPKIDLGFNLKRIYSWVIFEVRVLLWALYFSKKKPDIIIVSSLSLLTFLTGVLLKRYFKCKLICEVRDIWPLTIVEARNLNPKGLINRVLSKIEIFGYNKSDAIIGSMPNLIEHVKNVSPLNSQKVHYIPMGFDIQYWQTGASDLLNQFDHIFDENVPNGNFIVGYAGTIGLANCVDQILDAAVLLKDHRVTFMILGDGPLRSTLEKRAKILELQNVKFLEPVKKVLVQDFLVKCHLLVNPWQGGRKIYKYGVSPNKWIDYMYSGRPILVSLDGYKNIINEAECGLFIEADRPDLLAESILQFASLDKEELSRMGERGKSYLMTKLTYESLSARYLQIVDNV